ncbi:MAG: hypothetical protein KGZ35_02915 [Truepera sp.]|nr:hypothetical protein [Truepera sp.]
MRENRYSSGDDMLDPLDPEALFVPFRHAYGGLAEAGVLERFKVDGRLLVARKRHVASDL